LRDRTGDIPLILEKALMRHGMPPEVVSPEMLELMKTWHWPGNVRELLSCVESYVALLPGVKADIALFQEVFREIRGFASSPAPSVPSWDASKSLKENLEIVRTHFVAQAVKTCGGDRALAAGRLGISPATLWRISAGKAQARTDFGMQ
jgi:DNA-binding NtrC family response regulator